MTSLKTTERALPSVEKAWSILADTISTRGVLEIRAVAQAVATVERGKQIALDAGEIILMADKRLGQLTKEMQPAARGGSKERGKAVVSKGAQLKSVGLSRKQASICERVDDLSVHELNAYVKASKKAGHSPTSSGAARLAALEPEKRKTALATFADCGNLRAVLIKVSAKVKPTVAEEPATDLETQAVQDRVDELLSELSKSKALTKRTVYGALRAVVHAAKAKGCDDQDIRIDVSRALRA